RLLPGSHNVPFGISACASIWRAAGAAWGRSFSLRPGALNTGALPVLGNIPERTARLAVGIGAAQADVFQGAIAEGQKGLALAIDPVGLGYFLEDLSNGAQVQPSAP